MLASGRQQRQAIKFFIRQLNRWSTLEFFSFHLHENIFPPVRHSWSYSWLVTSSQTLHVKKARSGVGELVREREKKLLKIHAVCGFQRWHAAREKFKLSPINSHWRPPNRRVVCQKLLLWKLSQSATMRRIALEAHLQRANIFSHFLRGVIDPRSRNCQQFNLTLEIFASDLPAEIIIIM